ncbi:methylated-DNA--[protein]-cysteine S-methyltransferase [Acinetobacter sp. MD2]|uniref:methylated-DNA--[protein]-cysteine S-methyltransferase n=1 Tax=Acinetobacter sp. MD2 TaxID=2600066 RepID=UPI002D1F5A66|nr:methylated-DNA--[protein]-cysteine S-methyltransferase [Acinetobacter sp. MD2]MEB3768085.1 methylated-DNA--[protein]-cysteine S-methyltransferase [Acinetobacter sp. MD2]
MKLTLNTIPSPVGLLYLVADEQALRAVLWEHEYQRVFAQQSLVVDAQHPILMQAKTQLEEYFLGQRQHFELKSDPYGGTVFQRQVWQALQKIPFGETCCYSDIAKQIGNPKAVRAVGTANGRNPLSIIVPCHRVIGANGKLVGYAGGLEQKIKLLNLERRVLEASL